MFSFLALRSAVLLAIVLGTSGPVQETHSFELTRDQHQGFTFAVDGPGKIVARVAWRGSPLEVSLIGPNGAVARQTARSRVELTYTVTSADVGRGSAWRVAMRSTARGGSPIAVVAKGEVTIEHPAGDVQKLEAKFQAQRGQMLAQFRARAAQRRPQTEAAQKAQLVRYQQAQRQAQQQRQSALRQHVVMLRTRAMARPVRAGAAGVRSTLHPTSSPGSGSSASEPLWISSLSSTEGQPGDAILISGSGFGEAGAAGASVHLIPAPGKDVQLSPDYWSDTQIQTSIPGDISGIPDNPRAAIYVKTASGSSQLVPFHFEPAIATASIAVTTHDIDLVDESDCDLLDLSQAPEAGLPAGDVIHAGGPLCGGSGNDIWNRGKHLENGWTVRSIDFGTRGVDPDADAYIVQSHTGTADLSFTIHWWTTGGGPFGTPGSVFYSPVIYIQGPAGIPWQ